LTLLFLFSIIPAVHALAVVLTAAGVANIDILAAVDIDPDFLNDADKLGLGSLLPGPFFGKKVPILLNFRLNPCFLGLDE